LRGFTSRSPSRISRRTLACSSMGCRSSCSREQHQGLLSEALLAAGEADLDALGQKGPLKMSGELANFLETNILLAHYFYDGSRSWTRASWRCLRVRGRGLLSPRLPSILP
jgi:hypothetical protein